MCESPYLPGNGLGGLDLCLEVAFVHVGELLVAGGLVAGDAKVGECLRR